MRLNITDKFLDNVFILGLKNISRIISHNKFALYTILKSSHSSWNLPNTPRHPSQTAGLLPAQYIPNHTMNIQRELAARKTRHIWGKEHHEGLRHYHAGAMTSKAASNSTPCRTLELRGEHRV
jgi:hypothetical protein